MSNNGSFDCNSKKLVIYKKPIGIYNKIEEEYYKTRDIFYRYSPDQLANWREIDLYFILGIDSLKYMPLCEETIRAAYRNRVMRYHPDAGKYGTQAFLALQKAYAIIGDPVKRRKYDSICFDEEIPVDREYEPQEFFEIFGPCFFRNGWFSNTHPVPELGTLESSRDHVEKFYRFWKTFESWRSFEYLDDEDDEKGYSRRENEKKFKAKRNKLKMADRMRIVKLVDIALKRDPRVQKIREEEDKTSQINKKMENMSIDPNMITDKWGKEDLQLLYGLIKTCRVGPRIKWDEITKKYNAKAIKKKSPREILIKGNELNK
ncbi:Zuotin [Astathelohania contejeani]|uniref:Zuotin n=1 Tax=Astathelohania contejeani TaxID=164912 RepID=A0ABQ7I259_9MICR|nr:Zuotin [Thelohania contejeani]